MRFDASRLARKYPNHEMTNETAQLRNAYAMSERTVELAGSNEGDFNKVTNVRMPNTTLLPIQNNSCGNPSP